MDSGRHFGLCLEPVLTISLHAEYLGVQVQAIHDLRTDERGPPASLLTTSMICPCQKGCFGIGGGPDRKVAARTGSEGFGGQVFSVEGDHGT